MNCHFFVVQGSQASKYGDGLSLPLAMGGVSRDNLGDARLDARVPGAGLSAVVVEGRGKTEASLHRSVCRIRARQK